MNGCVRHGGLERAPIGTRRDPDRGVQTMAQGGTRAEADSFGDAVDRQIAPLQQLAGQVGTLLGEPLAPAQPLRPGSARTV